MKLIRNLWIPCLILVGCGILFTSITTRTSAARDAQEVQREEDLNKTFRKHELLKLDRATADERVRHTGKLSFVTRSGQKYELALMPNDLRARGFHALETLEGGISRALESSPVRTYKGSVSGMDNALARFTIDERSFEGMILTPDARLFVEPAKRYSDAAEIDEFVMYDDRDMIKREPMSCDVTLGEKVSEASHNILSRAAATDVAIRISEIATEADFEYVTALGGSAQANAEILSILNQVDAVYQRDVSMTLRVTFQHTWTTADPFNPTGGNNGTTLLNNFQSYWNANFPHTSPQFNRDTAHMWTGKQPFLGQGRAKQGVVCNTPTSAYAWSGKFDFAPNKYILTAHEIGHNFNAVHSEGLPGCAETIMIAISNQNTALRFCQMSIDQILGHVTANPSCLSVETVKTRFDFDGDSKSDLAVFRPTNGTWYMIQSQNGAFSGQIFGTTGDQIAPEDYDGDGKTDLAVFRPSSGIWYLLRSRDGFMGQQFGASGDRPVAADFDGDGKADIAVYRPSNGTWYISNSSNGSFTGVAFGAPGDLPAAGDYDGDGKADIAVFRPSNGTWYIQQSQAGFRADQFGANGDRPVPEDFDGDGKDDLGLFRPSNGGWYILQSTAGFRGQIFGNSLDLPVAADFDGDGKADVAVWRTTTGTWYILNSQTGSFRADQFGASGDAPAPSAYVP